MHRLTKLRYYIARWHRAIDGAQLARERSGAVWFMQHPGSKIPLVDLTGLDLAQVHEFALDRGFVRTQRCD